MPMRSTALKIGPFAELCMGKWTEIFIILPKSSPAGLEFSPAFEKYVKNRAFFSPANRFFDLDFEISILDPKNLILMDFSISTFSRFFLDVFSICSRFFLDVFSIVC